MQHDNSLEELLQKHDFDIATPTANHKERFLEKLNNTKKPVKKTTWLYYAAAVIVLCIATSFLLQEEQEITIETIVETTHKNLPKDIANAQFHFEGLIKNELVKIELERNKDTQEIIEDAFIQLKALETEQQNLQKQLNIHYDKRIVKALINNFQYRIQLLENVMKQIELTKEIKKEQHEII